MMFLSYVTFKDDIKFLRNELESKDKIIELMLKDKFNGRMETKINFVGKPIITNTESNDVTVDITKGILK